MSGMIRTKREWTRPLGIALSLVLLAGAPAARAQEKPAPAPLQGPKVTPNRPLEMEDEFAPGKGGDKFSRREPPIPMRAYVQAVNKLKGDDAPKDLRLSDEQDKKIQAVMEEFRAAVADFQRTSRDEMDQPPPPEGGKPADDTKNDARPRRRPGAAGEEGGKARERLQELRRNGPHPQEYETRIWNTLSEGQQKFVKADLDALREEQRKRQGEEYMKREAQKRRVKDGKEPPPGGPGAGSPAAPGPSPETRERVQRIFEKLRSLPPEEREQVLRHLEEDLDRHSAGDGKQSDEVPAGAVPARKKKAALDKPGRAGLRPERPGDQNLPAPAMDGVSVPKPSERKP
jgi:hypothetical protein